MNNYTKTILIINFS